MIVSLASGEKVNCVDREIASGADGAVYQTQDGTQLVKLYHNAEPWRLATLDAILGRFNAVSGDPYWAQLLCWPTAIVTSPRIGIVIPRADTDMRKLDCFNVVRWLKYHPEDVGNLQGRLGITIKVARAVRRLHFKGLCHSDLSGNNVLANPHDGRAYVIDCDGLVVPGQSIARPVVDGTSGWMAPELVAQEVTDPSVDTEKHALSVLIYETLLLRHPLRGRKVFDPRDHDRDESLRMGRQATFIEHPTDRSNRPQRLPYGYHLLGSAVGRLIERAFVMGLRNPRERPTPAEWERDLCRLVDTLVPCINPACSFGSFPLSELGAEQRRVTCPWCGTAMPGLTLPVLHWQSPVPGQAGVYRSDGTRHVGWQDHTIHVWHIEPHALPGPDSDPQVLATFQRYRDALGVARWLLVNGCLPHFEAADPGGGWKLVGPGQAVELKRGRKLRFGPLGTARDATVDLVEVV
ncbi:MAG TPA: hypothetical protein VLX59_17005 [Acidimicrobiales bacterium]|nr:hypothetical protein [Acidimicrobiales bacterium]